MNDKNLHIDKLENKSQEFFAKGKVDWEKSKGQVWDGMFLETKSASVIGAISKRQLVIYSVAASFLLLIGFSSFFYFYSKTVTSPVGEHIAAALPDGSIVEMNAGSLLKYFPYRWHISRDVMFEGEGFFEVKKGGQFVVKSNYGKTTVLGTTFNIFSRNKLYKVSCLTGKVRVTSTNKESVILVPNQQVIIKPGEELKKISNLNSEKVVSWRLNQFLFTATPLKDVVNEIERQYGIAIRIDENIEASFTGNFNKVSNVEEVLSQVCKPFGFKYVKQTEKNYMIIRNN